MKPLELAAYPICDCGPPGHYIDCDKTPTPAWLADLRAEDKRFTGAELAAEYWRAWAGKLDIDRLLTIERFATCPSYDE